MKKWKFYRLRVRHCTGKPLVLGNIIVISTVLGRSPRAVLITNEGVFLQPRVLFVAMATVIADDN